MEVTVNAVKFKASAALLEFIDKKAKKVETLLPQASKVEVSLKVDKDHDVCNKVADVRISVTGEDLFASKQCDTFEEAIDNCLDALKRQIEKLKEKWHK
ncbi:MAG: ribosome-associated translation inhibitor RaiA [Bacteroides sp.]|nr:ribosome-associated translation inhibitor RaiA [Bacteroides sp.]MCM1085053.1 ribosome-associated translation inhibitor RaiA [Bacteroides sp.]